MSKRNYWTVIWCCIFILSACNFIPQTLSGSEESKGSTSATADVSDAEPIDIEYADAKAEANFAIQKQDFHLLALNNKGISVPGIDLKNYALSDLEQQCGLKILANSGDEITEDGELAKRKKLFTYAAQYNQLVLVACREK
ncbi:hypothetical protein [Paraglaciecola sp.]|uniref:hypothetical protein n=1 Tax=Paraglaciecola sp. TaxID=1920173 RepID=UPI0030F48E33